LGALHSAADSVARYCWVAPHSEASLAGYLAEHCFAAAPDDPRSAVALPDCPHFAGEALPVVPAEPSAPELQPSFVEARLLASAKSPVTGHHSPG
jgi:hypothetical protein